VITINLSKAKSISHDIRRARRAEEFAPYDAVIATRVPGADLDAAEAARQAIRERYARLQAQLEQAQSPDELRQLLGL
jgi:hypothetical protein